MSDDNTPPSGGGPTGGIQSTSGGPAAPTVQRRGNSRLAAVLGVALPFSTYLFTEQQERMEQSRRKFEEQQQTQLVALEKDRQQALQIHQAVRDRQFPAGAARSAAADGQSICELLTSELRLREQGLLGPLALNMIFGLLASPRPAEPGGDPLLCACRQYTHQLDESEAANGKGRDEFQARLAAVKCPPTVDSLLAGGMPFTKAPLPPTVVEPPAPEPPPAPAPAPTPPEAEPEPVPSPPPPPAATGPTREQRSAALSALKIRPRLYIQIGDDKDRGAVQCLQKQLLGFGYLVPGIENVGSRRSPRVADLRWFAVGETEQMEWLYEDLRIAAKDCGFPRLQETIESMPKPAKVNPNAGKSRAYHFELWLPPLPAK